MSSHGVGTYSINSFWESGSLIFYEKAVGHTATGDVFTLGTTAVKVGGTSQDIDFQFYATGSKSAIIDAGAGTFTLTGITLTTAGQGITIADTSINATTGRIAKFDSTVLTPNFGDGYGAFEVNLNIGTGAIAGHVAGLSSWINLDAGTTMGSLGNCISPLDVGIYAPSGTFTNGKFIMGVKMSCVIDNGANPGELYLFNTNIYSNALTAMFDINAIADITATATAAATGAYKFPILKERSTGTTWYVNMYTS
jgi:hypothetical protein